MARGPGERGIQWHRDLLLWGMGTWWRGDPVAWRPSGIGTWWHRDRSAWGHADMGNGAPPALPGHLLSVPGPPSPVPPRVTVPPDHPARPYLPKMGSRVLGTYWSRWPSVFAPSETRT